VLQVRNLLVWVITFPRSTLQRLQTSNATAVPSPLLGETSQQQASETGSHIPFAHALLSVSQSVKRMARAGWPDLDLRKAISHHQARQSLQLPRNRNINYHVEPLIVLCYSGCCQGIYLQIFAVAETGASGPLPSEMTSASAAIPGFRQCLLSRCLANGHIPSQ
jgi:hypothetical protein